MRNRLFLILLIIASLFIFNACGDDSDDSSTTDRPDLSTTTDTSTSTDTGGSTTTDTSEGTQEDSSGGEEDTSGGEEDTSGGGEAVCGNGTVETGEACDDGNTNDGDGCSSTCQIEEGCFPDPEFAGQMIDDPEKIHNGGNLVTTPYSSAYTSGIKNVLDSLDMNSSDDVELNDIQITDATVVATAYNVENKQFWIADGEAVIALYLFDDETVEDDIPGFDIVVGQKISFVATSAKVYYGTPEITAGHGWTLGTTGNDVYVEDRTGGPALTVEEVNKMVRIAGTISNPTECGGDAMCYEMDYGAGETVTFRTKASVNDGDCVTWIGPVLLYSGAVQLNTSNFDWIHY